MTRENLELHQYRIEASTDAPAGFINANVTSCLEAQCQDDFLSDNALPVISLADYLPRISRSHRSPQYCSMAQYWCGWCPPPHNGPNDSRLESILHLV